MLFPEEMHGLPKERDKMKWLCESIKSKHFFSFFIFVTGLLFYCFFIFYDGGGCHSS